MRRKSLSFLKAILEAPSPSGYEQPVQRLWRDYVRPFADEVKTDAHGNTIGVVNSGAKIKVMLAGHCDEIGFIINYITDDGFLHFLPLGGHDVGIIPGRRVLIHTADGPIKGVIGKRAIHLMSPEERSKPDPKIEKYWIDIAVKDKKEAESLVQIGDPVTYPVAFEELRNNCAISRAFDDKAGSFIVAETLRILSEKKSELNVAVYGVSTVQEEIGLRGATTSAFGVDPDVGVAVDVNHATDSPDMDKRKVGDIKIGGGPVFSRGPNISPLVFDRLVAAAKAKKIAYQVDAQPRGTGTDANAIQLTRAGVATGLVSIPLRYMHTPVELISLDDVESIAKTFAQFCLDIEADADFSLS
jgi:tetrahedral aminopeptidase